jgi:hypothetical protein
VLALNVVNLAKLPVTLEAVKFVTFKVLKVEPVMKFNTCCALALCVVKLPLSTIGNRSSEVTADAEGS